MNRSKNILLSTLAFLSLGKAIMVYGELKNPKCTIGDFLHLAVREGPFGW